MAQTQITPTPPTLASSLVISPNQQQSIITIPNEIPDLENTPQKTTQKIPDLEKSGNQQQIVVTVPDLEVEVVDYLQRAQWLRAAVLGANDGLLSTAALMVGVGAVRQDSATMILTGAAGTVAGACAMAIGEFVSVYSQYDIEMSQIKRESEGEKREEMMTGLPSPLKAAGASASAFVLGAIVPLLAAAFVRSYSMRLGVVVAAVSLALIGFGALGAHLGRAPLVRSSLRVLFGGWLAMGITFGLTKAIGSLGSD